MNVKRPGISRAFANGWLPIAIDGKIPPVAKPATLPKLAKEFGRSVYGLAPVGLHFPPATARGPPHLSVVAVGTGVFRISNLKDRDRKGPVHFTLSLPSKLSRTNPLSAQEEFSRRLLFPRAGRILLGVTNAQNRPHDYKNYHHEENDIPVKGPCVFNLHTFLLFRISRLL